MNKVKPPPYIDDEEQEFVESFEVALDAGAVHPSSAADRAQASAEWKAMVERANARKAITLRLRTRDIEKLKVIARQRGLPYQTLLGSVLHQFAQGTLREARD
jgi:predicted DNA binding CopG/RHH family protein